MRVSAEGRKWKALHDGISSTFIAVVSLVRGLALFLSGRPRTPLRVLCIAAFDTLHVLRHKQRLPTAELKTLAALLDLGACANATFDHKGAGRHEWRATRQLLEDAGIGLLMEEYLRRLGGLESRRPLPAGDRQHFQEVRRYREAVVRLSLGMLAMVADGGQCLDESVAATYGGGDLDLLFRIVMQCQIIDDVLDYSQDRSAGLPSFLTACELLPQALELTRLAAHGYTDAPAAARAADVFPFRAALFLVSTCTELTLCLRR